MANNFGILTNTILLHDTLALALETLLPIADLVIDVESEVEGPGVPPGTMTRHAKPGSTITIKDWTNTLVPYQVGAAGYNQPTDLTATDKVVTMPNIPWAVSFALTPAEYRLLAMGVTGGADYEKFRTRMAQAMQFSLGKKVLEAWFSIITAANYPNATVTPVGTFSRSTEVDLDSKFFGREMPTLGAQGILPTTTYAEWVKDHIAIQTNTAEDRQKGLLISGGIQSQNSAFFIRRTNRPMPADAARGFVCSKPATIAVFRIPYEPTYENDPVSLSEVVDPRTKIAMLARVWKNAQTGVMQMDLAIIFLFAVGQPAALERLVAA